ncbi:hypothetical protein [Ancylobacter mangrovi]|uniref:Uncharacterized protein n=1 Tax=Ancylobacter mangrovi TaxID=2972472 RepID=A0A9X2PFS2_9HYPH|nr:hypothetical protein [Ancylobacter mangrovi]MCS0497891.1 hypothetical protein [Ancylobacter mangrovi]MCS0501590.1 hypothetical protein [Ancylobacter mangrovi]
MENELRSNLRVCAEAYATARGFELSTVGRLAANDGSFFSRIASGRSFTARKYDEIIRWFSTNWPSGVEWPEGVPRAPVNVGTMPDAGTSENDNREGVLP